MKNYKSLIKKFVAFAIFAFMAITAWATEAQYKVLLWNSNQNDSQIRKYAEIVKYHYEHIEGVTVVEKTSGELTDEEIDDVQLVFLINICIGDNSTEGQNILNSYEKLKNFVESGGRVIMNGENAGWTANGNQVLSTLAASIGGNFTITTNNSSDKSMLLNSSQKGGLVNNINAENIQPSSYAHIESTNPDAIWVMKDKDGKVFILDQAVESGYITVITDINWMFISSYNSNDYTNYSEPRNEANRQFLCNSLVDSAQNIEQQSSCEGVAKVIDKGTATDYETLSEAVTAWNNASEGAILKLFNDVTSPGIVVSGRKVLDLNGYGINGNKEVITVIVVNGNLTLKDSNPGSTHKFTVSNVASNGAGLATVNDALTGIEGTDYKTFTGGYITGGTSIGENCGGGIRVVSGATLNMKGGTIIGNGTVINYDAGMRGSGVMVQGTFNMSGGSIIYNYAWNEGGGVDILSSSANMTMSGGKISHNYAKSEAGGVHGWNNPTFTMSGGEITSNYSGGNSGGVDTGGIYGTTKLSGSPVIKDNIAGTLAQNLYIKSGCIQIIDELTDEAAVYVTIPSPGVFTNSTNTAFNDARKFFSDDANYTVLKNSDGQLKVSVPPVATVTTSAGVTTEYDTFAAALAAWVNGSTLTLYKDVETSSTINVPSGTFVFDLNGHGILMTANQTIFKVANNTNLTMKDSNPSKVHYVTLSSYRGTAVSDTGTESAVVAGTGTGVVKITGGYLTGGIASIASAGGGSYKCGGAVYVEGATGTFTLKSGTLIGNRSDDCDGGGIHVAGYGHVNIEGGRICYNKAVSGGGIRIGINGGTQANGIGYVNISGGTIDYNYASYAGGIRINYGDLTLSGGSIVNNLADRAGGIAFEGGEKHIYVSGNPVVKNNKTSAGADSNIYFYDNAFLYKTGSLGADAELHVTSHNLPTASADLKIGNDFATEDLKHIYCDNAETAGVVYDSGSTNWVSYNNTFSVIYGAHHESEAKTLWLSVIASTTNIEDSMSVAKVTTRDGVSTGYATLAEALTNWVDGSTLKLLADGSISDHINITGDRTIDLNGFGLRQTASPKTIFYIDGAANKLTIEDSYPTRTGGTNRPTGITGGYITGGTGYKAGNYKRGGAILIANSGYCKMTGGTLTGNTADFGGAVQFWDGTFEMIGGTITDNSVAGSTTYHGGGAVWCETDTAIFIMGGTAEIYGNNGNGGYGDGQVVAYASRMTLSGGSPKIYNSAGNRNLLLLDRSGSYPKMNFTGELSSDTIIYIWATNAFSIFTDGIPDNSAAYSYVNYFVSEDENRNVVVDSPTHQLAFASAEYVASVAKTQTVYYQTLEDAVNDWVDGSTLALLKDCTIEDTIVAPAGNLTLDLNGYGILMTNNKTVLKVGDTSAPKTNLTMIDNNQTRVHYVTLNDYHATAVADTGTESVTNGTGTVKITGGYIAGGQTGLYCVGNGTGETYKAGAGIYVGRATFTMEAGTIIGNKNNESGGGLHVGGIDSHLIINGGRICYNSANGGGGLNVGINGYIKHPEGIGKFTMNGGHIDCNYAASDQGGAGGGGIRLNNGEIHFNGGSIINNRTKGSSTGGILYDHKGACAGGINCIYVSGNPVLKDNYNGNGVCNLYLDENTYIYQESGKPLTEGAELHISTKVVPTASQDVKIGVGFNMTALSVIHSDNAASSGIIFDSGDYNWAYTENNVAMINANHQHEEATVWLSNAASTTNIENNIIEGNWEISAEGYTLTATLGNFTAHLIAENKSVVPSRLKTFNEETLLGATVTYKYVKDGQAIDSAEEPGLYSYGVVVLIKGQTYTLTLPQKLLVLDENVDNTAAITAAAEETSVDVAITRSFGANFNSLCLPFALTEEELETLGATAFKPAYFDARRDNKFKFSAVPVANTEAGKPYLIRFTTTNNWENLFFANKAIVKTPSELKLTGITVKGTFVPVEKPESGDKTKLFIKAGGAGFTYAKADDDSKLGAFRAWFEQDN